MIDIPGRKALESHCNCNLQEMMMMIFMGTLFCNLHRDADGLYHQAPSDCNCNLQEEQEDETHIQR